MKRIYVVLAILALALPLSAGGVNDDLKMLADTFVAGGAKGDAALITSIYADDAVLMPPNAPAVRGREAIRQFWTGMLQGGTFGIALKPQSIAVHGDLAVEQGMYELTSPVQESGKYVLVFRKQNGKWLAVSDIWNANQAPAAPMAAAGTQ